MFTEILTRLDRIPTGSELGTRHLLIECVRDFIKDADESFANTAESIRSLQASIAALESVRPADVAITPEPQTVTITEAVESKPRWPHPDKDAVWTGSDDRCDYWAKIVNTDLYCDYTGNGLQFTTTWNKAGKSEGAWKHATEHARRWCAEQPKQAAGPATPSAAVGDEPAGPAADTQPAIELGGCCCRFTSSPTLMASSECAYHRRLRETSADAIMPDAEQLASDFFQGKGILDWHYESNRQGERAEKAEARVAELEQQLAASTDYATMRTLQLEWDAEKLRNEKLREQLATQPDIVAALVKSLESYLSAGHKDARREASVLAKTAIAQARQLAAGESLPGSDIVPDRYSLEWADMRSRAKTAEKAAQKADRERDIHKAAIAQVWSILTGWDAARIANNSHVAADDPCGAAIEAAKAAKQRDEAARDKLSENAKTFDAVGKENRELQARVAELEGKLAEALGTAARIRDEADRALSQLREQLAAAQQQNVAASDEILRMESIIRNQSGRAARPSLAEAHKIVWQSKGPACEKIILFSETGRQYVGGVAFFSPEPDAGHDEAMESMGFTPAKAEQPQTNDCPSTGDSDCELCSGERCEKHGVSPCDCDVIDRHEQPMDIAEEVRIGTEIEAEMNVHRVVRKPEFTDPITAAIDALRQGGGRP